MKRAAVRQVFFGGMLAGRGAAKEEASVHQECAGGATPPARLCYTRDVCTEVYTRPDRYGRGWWFAALPAISFVKVLSKENPRMMSQEVSPGR